MVDSLAVVAAPDEPVTRTPQNLTPVSPLERVELLDVLRGFALFGVLIANMKGFSLPMDAYFGFEGVWEGLSPIDKAVDRFIVLVAKSKFLALFSFLFGIGLSLQLASAQAKGVSLVPRYIRRLLVLLLFGFAHVWLFWWGDILHTYALAGFLLLLFCGFSEKALARVVVFGMILILLADFGRSMQRISHPVSPGTMQTSQPQKQLLAVNLRDRMSEEVRVLSTGTFSEQIQLRVRQWAGLYLNSGVLVRLGMVLHLFLMGLYVGKRRILHDVEANQPFLKACMWFGLACGVGGLAGFIPRTPEFPAAGFVRALLGSFTPFVFFFYAAGIAILVHRSPWWRRMLGRLAPVGRMALTNYLTHSVVASLIFYSYGLGYFGRIGSAWGLVLSLVIFAGQIPLCAWWLRHYQFGPAEWLWRSLTYGKLQPMKVRAG